MPPLLPTSLLMLPNCHTELLALKHEMKNNIPIDWDLPIRGSGTSPIRLSPNSTFASGETPLEFRQKILWNLANWRKFTVLPPTPLLEFHQLDCELESYISYVNIVSWQLAKVYCTFANASSGISPIDESTVDVRQYTPGLSPLANVLLAKVLLAKFR